MSSRPLRAIPLTAPALTGTALGAALAIATPQIMQWEGKRNDPYRDIAGILTVCHGETHALMRRYSDAECASMLATRVEADYARPVLACVPGFATRPHAFAAAISLSYNIGTGAFCRSSAARAFRAGDWAGGCDAFLRWDRAAGRTIPGLARRRMAERRLCLGDQQPDRRPD